MTITISNPTAFYFITFILGSAFILCAWLLAHSVIAQLVRTADLFFAVFDTQSNEHRRRQPATPSVSS